MNARINRGLAYLTPYQVSAGATMPGDVYLRLDWNEAQVPPAPQVIDALVDGLNGLNFYPDVEATDLRLAVGAYVGLPAECVRATNGSDAALRDICAAFLSPGDRALVKRPVYTQIDTFLAVQNATAVDWTSAPAWKHEIRRHMDELRAADAALAYIVNPNNPTGELYTPAALGLLAGSFPETVFLVDEAYTEFCTRPMSAAAMVRSRPNVLVTRTFSKAFGLAGLRLGYVLGHPETLWVLDRVRNGKEVNVLAQRAGVAALSPGGIRYMRAYVADVRSAMDWTARALRAMDYEVRRTPANFLLLWSRDPGGLVAALRARGVLVRDRSRLPGMAGWVRVTVGLREAMEWFVAEMEALSPEYRTNGMVVA